MEEEQKERVAAEIPRNDHVEESKCIARDHPKVFENVCVGDRRSQEKDDSILEAANVRRPLASMNCICEAGHTVVFKESGSCIFNNTTGEINTLQKECGTYVPVHFRQPMIEVLASIGD